MKHPLRSALPAFTGFFWGTFLIATVVTTGGRVLAQSVLEPRHVAQLQSVQAAAVSPTGTQVAYTLSVPRQPLEEDDGRAWSHLYVLDLAGQPRPFITGEETIGSPQWTHDGKAILYTARRGDDKHTSLYRIPVDGGESVRALQHATSIGAFSLHPDGRQVAFLAKSEEDEEATKWKDQGFDQEVFEEDWQPTRVWIAALDDAESEPRMLDLPGSASLVHWNHAGTQLAVVLAPTPSVDDSYMAKQLHVVDAETGRVLQKVEHAAKMGEVAWSPDDRYLAMIAGIDIHDPKDGRLMLVNTEGEGQATDLMPDYLGHVNSFAWQSKQALLWTSGEGTLARVGTVTTSGQVKTLVEPSPEAGILSRVSLAQSGSQAVLVGHSRSHAAEAISLDARTGKIRRLTDSNPWLEDIQLARQETVQWKAADGLSLEGVLIYPLDYEAGKRYPMIMVVHGGPESHESDGWVTAYSKPGHMGAARGFFVFYPNYRGSTGRGVEFSMLGQADAAGKEFSDLVDGVDHLVDQGLVDKNRVGITGGSYGGFASAWGATYYSDRFAASVMFVGISDNVSKVGTTDIPNEMFFVHHRKRLWDDWEYFLKSSPIRYVQRNRTPTLILHGKEDPRVHPSQSLELHRHLKTLGQAPVRLVLYEGEGHGNRKAAARLDYSLRQLRWMEHFLKEDAQQAPSIEVDYEAALDLGEDED